MDWPAGGAALRWDAGVGKHVWLGKASSLFRDLPTPWTMAKAPDLFHRKSLLSEMFFWKLHGLPSHLQVSVHMSVFHWQSCLRLTSQLSFTPNLALPTSPPWRVSTIILPYGIWSVLFLVHSCLGRARPFVCGVLVVFLPFTAHVRCKIKTHGENEICNKYPLVEASEHEFVFFFFFFSTGGLLLELGTQPQI